MRAKMIHTMIEEGERNPYRLIKRLENYERLYFPYKREDGSMYWTKKKRSGETIPGQTPAFRNFSFRGNIIPLPYHTTANLHRFLLDFIAATGPYDCIIELGCGYGRNIFELWYEGGPAEAPYFGGEFTRSGVELARELAALEPSLNATFFPFDHTAPDFSSVPYTRRALVFTMHSLEQVRLISTSWFQKTASVAADVTCVHLEPFGFQLQDLGASTQLHRQCAAKRGWNQNFVQTVLAARDAGIITPQYLGTELFISEPENPTSLAVWRATDASKQEPNH